MCTTSYSLVAPSPRMTAPSKYIGAALTASCVLALRRSMHLLNFAFRIRDRLCHDVDSHRANQVPTRGFSGRWSDRRPYISYFPLAHPPLMCKLRCSARYSLFMRWVRMAVAAICQPKYLIRGWLCTLFDLVGHGHRPPLLKYKTSVFCFWAS